MMRDDYNYRFKLTDYTQLDRNRKRKVAVYPPSTRRRLLPWKTRCSGTTIRRGIILGDSGPVYRRGHYRYPGQEKALLSTDD